MIPCLIVVALTMAPSPSPRSDTLRAVRLFRNVSQQVHAPLGLGLFPPESDHRWEGLAIGAIIGGALIASFVHSSCSEAHSSCTFQTTIGFLEGATIGGVIGVFVGSTVPKAQDGEP